VPGRAQVRFSAPQDDLKSSASWIEQAALQRTIERVGKHAVR